MNCLIYSPPEQTAWLKNYFPGVNPYYLKILNKPLLEYYIEFCVLLGIKKIRVVNSETSTDLEKYFGTGRQWGIDLSYGFSKPGDKLKNVLLKNKRFCTSESLLLISGFFFIHYDKVSHDYNLVKSPEPKKKSTGTSELIFIPDTKDIINLDFSKVSPCIQSKPEISQISSVKDYYQLNMQILQESRDSYFLPGYNNEAGVYLGKNIIDKKTTQYKKPLVLGDNVQIQMNTDIGPSVVLGNNVIIDHSTKISESIIYEHSYIGSELEINNKIIYRKRLIDPESEEVLQIVDSFLVSDIQNSYFQSSLTNITNSIFAVILMIITIVPYFLFIILSKIGGLKTHKKIYYRNKETDVVKIQGFTDLSNKLAEKIFFRFSLDLFPFYLQVIRGKLLIVGNHLLPRDISVLKNLDLLPFYQPGVYSYSGSMLHNTYHENYINDELEYCHTKSFWYDVKIVIQSWISRLFSDWETIKKYFSSPCEEKSAEDS